MAKKVERNARIKPPMWEWIIALVGLVFVIGALGTAIYRAVTEDATVPILTFSVEQILAAGDGYVVEFKVANSGSQTAAGLTVEGQLKKGGVAIETSTANLTYAPANSTRSGGLFFTKDPREFEITLRATGYEKP